MTTEPTPVRPRRRPRLATGLTRTRLLAILRERGRAVSTRELATDLGLHPNSVREQLDGLVADGLARRMPAARSGRGRPGLRYLAIPRIDEAAPYRDLARTLADELDRLPDSDRRAVSAGERWGRATVGPATVKSATVGPATEGPARAGEGSAADPIETLVAVLEAGGFAPEPPAEEGSIRLRRCPFGTLARERRSVVCGVHLGLMRGVLDELGAPIEGVRLEPFVEADLCLAHVGSPRDAPTSEPAGASGRAIERPQRRRRGSPPDGPSVGA